MAGTTPVFCDVDASLQLDPTNARATGVLEAIDSEAKGSNGLLGRLRRKG